MMSVSVPQSRPAAPAIRNSGFTVVSTKAFIASASNELAFPLDAYIWDVEETTATLWTGSYAGHIGVFPGTLQFSFTLIKSKPR